MKKIIALTLLVGLSGCYMYDEYPLVERPLISQPPPAPIIEPIPPVAFEGAVWVQGYWHWTGNQYVWVKGRHVKPPQPGLVWYPGYYLRKRRGVIYYPGHWGVPEYNWGYSYDERYRTYPSYDSGVYFNFNWGPYYDPYYWPYYRPYYRHYYHPYPRSYGRHAPPPHGSQKQAPPPPAPRRFRSPPSR